MKKLKKLSVLALLAVGFALVFGGCSNADDETKTEQGGGGDGTDKGNDSDKKEEEKEEEKEDEVVTVTDATFEKWYGDDISISKNVITLKGNGGAYYADVDISKYSKVTIKVKGSHGSDAPENGMKFAVKVLSTGTTADAVDLGYPEIPNNGELTLDESNLKTKTIQAAVEELKGKGRTTPFYLCFTNNSNDNDWSNGPKWSTKSWDLSVEKIEFIP